MPAGGDVRVCPVRTPRTKRRRCCRHDARSRTASARGGAGCGTTAWPCSRRPASAWCPGSGFGQLPGTLHFRTTFLPPQDEIEVLVEKLQVFHETYVQSSWKQPSHGEDYHRRTRHRGRRPAHHHRGGPGERDRDPAFLLASEALACRATAGCAWWRWRKLPKLVIACCHPGCGRHGRADGQTRRS